MENTFVTWTEEDDSTFEYKHIKTVKEARKWCLSIGMIEGDSNICCDAAYVAKFNKIKSKPTVQLPTIVPTNQLIIHLTDSVESTEDCKEQLNALIGNKKWKRLYKLGDIRCFINEDKEVVTIAEGTHAIFEEGEYDETEIEYCLFVGLDIQAELKAIKEIANFYYTCDYGELFYNPYTKTIHIVGGDGGYCYSPTKLKRNADGDIDFEEIDRKGFKEFNTHPQTTFIQNVTWADEYFPEEDGFILVGKIKDFED
jgi:hypothetical protein